jgi:hypothetical protein
MKVGVAAAAAVVVVVINNNGGGCVQSAVTNINNTISGIRICVILNIKSHKRN